MKYWWIIGLLIFAACSEEITAPVKSSSPVITITFDDGYEGVYDYAYPILLSYKLNANVAIFTAIWSDSTHWPDRLTISQTKLLYNSGWSVVSHSVTHPNLLTLMPDSIHFELIESKHVLDSLNFHSPDIFIVPYMLEDIDVLYDIQSVYKSSRCCVLANWSNDTLISLPTSKTDYNWYRLVSVDVSNYSDDNDQSYNFTTELGRENLERVLQESVNTNKFVDIVFHNITASDTIALKQTLDIINQFRPYIKTYNQIIK